METTAASPIAYPYTVAVIDIGSNAIRMAIAQVVESGGVVHLEDLQRPIGLGQDSFTKGRIRTQTINHAIEILRGFQKVLQPYEIGAFRAVATSAIRESMNRDLFVERVFVATGIDVQVITGSEQDRLIYKAVQNILDLENLGDYRESMIVEMGSGSVETSIFKNGQVAYSGTFPIGTIRLRRSVGTAELELGETSSLMQETIGPSLDMINQNYALNNLEHVVFVGGDVRFAAEQIAKRILKSEAFSVVGRAEFLKFARSMGQLRPEEIVHRYHLAIQDAETLSPALLFYSELLKRTRAREVIVPRVSMRDGLILDLIAEKAGEGFEEFESQVVSSAENIGRKYLFNEEHARHVERMALRFFDLLQEEHRLARRERMLLRVASLLHDIGLFVSNRAHHKHTEYLLNASEIFGITDEERAQVACIARYHRRATPRPTHPGYMALTRPARATVSKLAAMLRLAEGLDRSHVRKIENFRLEIKRDEMIIRVPTTDDLTLEKMAIEDKETMFEEVFGKKVYLEAETSGVR